MRESILGILEGLATFGKKQSPEEKFCQVCKQVYKGKKDCATCIKKIEVRE